MTNREVLDGIVDGTISFDDLVEFALDVIGKEVWGEFQAIMTRTSPNDDSSCKD